MLRWVLPLLAAAFAVESAAASDRPANATSPPAAPATPAPVAPAATPPAPAAVAPAATPPAAAAAPATKPAPTKPIGSKGATARAARQLPAGLPRPHYSYRTTVTAPSPAPYARNGRQLVVVEVDAAPLITPFEAIPSYVQGEPFLPGRSTLPGYYGYHYAYSYDGPYYGGPYYGAPYWERLPYACGIYGYC